MRVFTCKHGGHWLGGVSLIVAPNEEVARIMLSAELPRHGVPEKDHGPLVFEEVNLEAPQAIVLDNGDY